MAKKKDTVKKETKKLTDSVRKLTLAELNKQNKKLNEKDEFSILIGEERYVISHDVHFRNSKIMAVIDDVVAYFNESRNKVELLDLALPYINLLIIKHFTSLEVSDDIDEAIDLLNVLGDLEVFGDIISALPENEVVRTFDMIEKVINNYKDNLEDTARESQEILKQLESDELKQMLDNGIDMDGVLDDIEMGEVSEDGQEDKLDSKGDTE